MNNGIFTISLDYELYWGVRDKRDVEQYQDNLDGVEPAILQMLQVFEHNNIHATWATVGLIFCKDIADINQNLPAQLPNYQDETLSPYDYIKQAVNLNNAYHFSPKLIQQIAEQQGQEIATHTFSHYYCLEAGQTQEQFEADIIAAVNIAQHFKLTTKSLVFPRNQENEHYTGILKKYGIECYRGNETHWMYQASNSRGQTFVKRILRLLDSYIDISGSNTYSLQQANHTPFNFRASRFLRPYSSKLKLIDGLKLIRIKKAMTYAAKNNEIFHLWWHPHNFGANTQQNIEFLQAIVAHYQQLQSDYNMQSLNMYELCQLAEKIKASE